jgi:NADH-quinone oxidoreductase subunit N
MNEAPALSALLQQIWQDARLLLPEAWVAGGLLAVLLIDLILIRKPLIKTWLLPIVTIVFIGLAGWDLYKLGFTPEPVSAMSRMWWHDNWSLAMRGLSLAGAALCILLWRFRWAQQTAEYYALILGVTLASMLMSGSANLLLIYLSLETASICAYLLTGFSFTRAGAEAGVKYLLFGAVSSAIMLYGFSLLYGFTGTLDVASYQFFSNLLSEHESSVAILLAAMLALVGLLYKTAVAPFHLWVADVYEGAPLPAVAFMSVVPKLAGFALLYRVLIHLFKAELVFIDFPLDWRWVLGALAIFTMVLGSLAALGQKDMRRLMAYSSVAHSGFLLSALLIPQAGGIEAFWYYAIFYTSMSFAGFLLIELLKKASGSYTIESLRGLGVKIPLTGVLVVLVMVALTGLPPTSGFLAKLLLFSGLWQGYQNTQQEILLWLLGAGVLNTILALFFYLKIPYALFIQKGNESPRPLGLLWERIGAVVLSLSALILFFWPEWLLNLISILVQTIPA